MDNPNITIEEYIRLEEEKTRKHGKVFNWKTAKYGKIWYDEDIHDLISVESEFPAIAFNDGGLEYSDVDIADFEERLERNYSREIHRGGSDALVIDEEPADPYPYMHHHYHPPLHQDYVIRMARKEGDVHEICGALTEQCEVIDAMARDFS
ncbi:hypothetical protein Tco_0578564 [Tanacetum coccineum]